MADKKNRKNIVQINPDDLIDLTGLRARIDAEERQRAPAPMPEEPSMLRSLGDSGIAAGTGLVTGVKLISDAFGADNAVSRTLGEANQGMQGLLSPYRQAELQNRARLIREAEQSGSTAQEIGAYFGGAMEAPLDTLLNVAGTAAPTMASMLIPGAREANVARLLGVGTGAIQGAGAGKSAIYDAVLQQKLQEGVPEAEARAIADAAQSYGGDNTDTILANTALGAVAGGSGLESAARALKYGKAAQAAPGLARRVGTGAVVEGLPEAGQGGMEQASANIALQREGYDVPTMRGVAGSAALEGVAGGALGGAFAIPSPSEPAADVPPAPIVPVTGPLTKAVNAGAGPVANAASQANANALAEMDKLAQEEGGAEQAPAAPADPLKAYRATPQPTPEQAAQAEQALAAEADQNELAGMESAGRSPQSGNLAELDAAPSQAPAAPAFASLDEADDYVTAQVKRGGAALGVPIQNDDGTIGMVPKSDPRYVQAVKDRLARKKAAKEKANVDPASVAGAGVADGTGVQGNPGVAGEPAIDAGSRPADAGQPVVDPEQRGDAVQPGRDERADALTPSMVAATKPQPTATGPAPITVQPAGTRGTTAADVIKPTPKAEAATQPVDKAAAPAPEMVRVRDVYGQDHWVRRDELDSDKTLLRRHQANGTPLKENTRVNRENLDPSGEKAAEAWKDLPIFDNGGKGFKSRKALDLSIKRARQDPARYDIQERNGLFFATIKPTDAQADTEGTGTQATQAPADQAPATTGSDAGRAEQQPVDAGAGSAPVEADGVTAKIERAKRRLRENRNKQATTGVREELTKLKAQEQDIEREIRSLRQQAVADEPAPAPAPATAPTKGLGAQLAELNAELERQGPVQNANTRAKRDAIRKQIAEQDFPDILRAVDDDLATAEELNAAFKYAGDEPKAKTIARIFKKRGITDEYAKRWTERLLGADDGQADDTMDDPEMAAYEGGKTGKTRAQDKAKVAEDAAKAKAQADLDAALGDLGDIFGKNTRLMMMPEQEQKLLPVLTRVLDAAFRLGYYKFKDAARFALNTIRAKLGAEVADSITLDHLQGAYIGMAGKYQGQGADSKRDVINVESLSEIAETNEQDNNEPTTAGGNDASPSQAERVPASDPQPDRGDAATRSGDRQPLDARVASDGPGSDPVGGVPASPEGPGAAGAGSAGQRNDTPPRAPRNSGAVRPDGGAAESGGNDFDLTGEDIGTGGLARKYKDNIAAIRILKAMDLEGRVATPDERKQLARYVGWGALKAVFDPANAKWAKQHAELKELLTEAEWKAARASTLNAHYTDKNTVSAMFDALAKLGFKSGRVLEPSVGSGNFFGMMPAGMRNKSSLFGIELDPMTAKLAQALYPSAKVKNSGFEDFEIPSGYFDVVIGNPPFGSEPIKDAQRSPYSGFSIHNYFLAKAIDKLRPGGLMQVVVSHNFLDAQDGRARKWIGERANLIGAVRLPNTAFKENAGTVVVTDILIFQKKVDGVPTIDIAPWQDVVDQTNVNEKTGESAVHKVNQFFTARPDLVLGTPSAAGTMRKANEYTVQPSGDLTAQLGAWVQTLPENVYEPVERGPERAAADVAVPDGIKVGSFFVDEKGRVMTRGQDDMGERTATAWAAPNGAADKRVRGMIALRDLLRRQMRLERDPASSESDISANRAELSKQYDAFLKGYGHLNSQANRRLFLDDPEAPLLQALELDYDKGVSKATAEREDIPEREPSASKADIFSRRVVFPPQDMMAVSSAKDALLASLNFKGRVDMDYMATVYDKSPAAMLNELGDMVFDDPQAGLVMADEYLSGDVKTKLAEAEAAARDNPALRRNVEALRAVIPADKKPSEITVSIGAAFVPEDVYRDFFKHITGGNLTLGYLKATGQWLTQESGQMDAALNRGKFGTPELSASDLFQLSMLGRGAVVKKTYKNADGSTTTVVLEKETEAARAKQEAIKAEWKSWIWKDGERASRLSAIYNEKMNRLVPRKFDGSHLQFPGMSPAISLLEHQKNGVWRGLQTFQTLYDHVVGAGKTFEMATLAMEMRRLGIARKPIFVVPNHLTLQWRSEFTRLYPTSNVLAATPEDFGKGMREKMFSKIVTGDWDAVIIGHSSLKKIGLPVETETAIMQEQIDEISDAIEDMKRRRGDRNIVGDMERIRKTLEGKLKEKLARLGTRDKVLTFDELGIDAVFVDEMHEFKNLTYTSTMDRVPGMGNPKGSDKSFDLFVKLRWMFDTFGKKAPIITATGTPVSNSLVEMYNMQRFMQYPSMKELGTHVFDAWARQFGSVESVYEVSPSGTGFRQSTRFAKFTNLSALMGQYNSFADVITLDDLKQQAEDRGERFPVPKVAGGRPKIVVAERSPQVAEFMGVPRVQTGEDGALQFLADVAKDAPEFSQDTNGKWVAKVGQAQFANLDTLEDAKLKVVEKALTPNVAVDPKSILGQFGNLRQLTKESKGKINALSLTGQANKAGLDYRLIDPSAPDFKGSKINLAVDEAMALYKKWSADKGAQLIFCDLSIPLSARANVGAKAVRVYVRGTEGLAHKRGTLHAIEGFEGLPFIITEQGAGAAKQFDLYDAASGVLLRSGFKSKQEAKDKADSLLRNTPMRDKWLLAREEAGEIEQEQIDEYNDLNEIDTEESASITRADIAGMSGDSKFSVYDDIKAKLIARGVPEREIAFIHDYDTPTAKAKLFRAVNKGDVRFLLGSTPKMGAGTNVQERLVGLHHIDAPWRPSDLEQREGRIIRRGSALYERDPDNYEVEIFRYATSQTYDTRRWQILEHKAKGIEQLRNFDGTFNEIEDIAGEAANSADMKAAASGDPMILEETRLRNDVRRLEQLEAAHADNVVALGRRAENAKDNAERHLPKRLEMLNALAATLKANPVPKDGFPSLAVNGVKVSDREGAVAEVQKAINYVVTSALGTERGLVYRGVEFTLSQHPTGSVHLTAESTGSDLGAWARGEAISPTGLLQRLANYADRVEGHIEDTKAEINRNAEQAVALRKQSMEPWSEKKDLEKAREDYRRVQRALIAKGPAVPDDQKAALKDALEAQKQALRDAGLGEAVAEFLGSSSAPMFSRRNGRGIPMRDAQAGVDIIRAQLPGAPEITLLERVEDAPPELVKQIQTRGAANDVEAVYWDGQIYAFPQHFDSLDRFVFVVGRHEVRHAGFDAILGDQKEAILLSIGRANRRVMREAKQKMADGLATSEVEAIEEALADMPVEDVAALTRIKVLVAAIRRWLRSTAFKLRKAGWRALADSIEPKTWTDNDVIAFVFKAEGVSRGPGGGSRFSRDNNQPFYSELRKQIAGVGMNAAPAKGWSDTLKGMVQKGQVKQDEIEWTGLGDWLPMQTGKVSKQQVLEFLAANGVQVQEVALGTSDTSGERETLKRYGLTVEVNPEDPGMVGFFNSDMDIMTADEVRMEFGDEAGAAARRIEGVMLGNESNPKYATYQLPGGQNYREVLLTLPVSQAKLDEQRARRNEALNTFPRTPEAQRVLDETRDGGVPSYRSSHWDQPNVLAHIRVNDRVDADGKRVLFVEEIQSDWGQDGKKKGFKTSESPRKATAAIRKEGYWEVRDQNGDFITNVMDYALPDANEEKALEVATARLKAENATNMAQSQRVPRAPFVDKTDAWLSLALKRIVKMAVDEGYDRVAFITGEQSAERYDLSKSVASVRWESTAGDTVKLTVTDYSNRNIIDREMPSTKVDDYIGKELGDKIRGAIADGRYSGGFSGDGLKVGGEGMKAFYDKIVPAAVNKLLAKVGGGKVEEMAGSADVSQFSVERDKGEFVVARGEEIIAGPFATRSEALKRMREEEGRGGLMPDGQMGFTITPAMREKVAGGMPLFSRAKVVTIRNSLATLREAGARKAEAVRDANLFAGYKVGDFMQSTGRLSWWDKSIGTPFNLAKRYPGTFGRVFNAVQDFLNDVSFYGTEAANLAPTLLPKLDKLRDITKSAISAADNRAISAPIFDGTLNWTRDKKGRPIRMEQAEAEAAKLMTVDEKARELLRSDLLAPGVLKMWQGLPLDQYEANVESRYASQLLRPGIVFTPDELRSIFKLTQAQAGLYKEFRASVDRSLDDLTVSEITRLVRNEWPGAVQGEGQSAEDFAEEVRQALMDMESRDTADKVAAMANRLTDLKAKGYAPLSRFGHFTLDVVDADGERVYFGLFESQSEANMKARQMREQFPQATVTQGTQSQEAYKMLAGVSPETIELFGEILGLDATGDKESDKAFQEYLKKAKSTRSAMKRLIHRKGIAGFSEDSGRVLAGFITSNARRTSSNHHLKGIMDAVDAMPREQGELKDYAARMAEYVNSPVEEAQALRGLMFAQYLGGSVASALVNMTQPIAVTLPFLSQHTTAAKAAKLVTGAMADMASRKKLETGLENALKLAEEKGIVAPQEVHYLQAQASGSGALVSGDGTKAGDAWAKAKNGWSRLSFGWGKLFGFAELVNRRATFIASYRLAVQNKYPDPFKFASDAVEETQFVYNKGNRPEWARGAIGATLFTFKTYSISYVELLSRMWKLGGPEGKKALALALATMILMSGVDELPFMEDIEDVIDGVAQRVFGLNWQTKAKRNAWAAEVLGKDLAAFLARGVSGVPGVPMDVSGRLGMGNLLPGTGLFRKDSQDPARDVAEIAGPVGDLLKRGFTAAGMAAQGDLTKAALEVSPVAIRNVAKAADMADSGIYTDSGGKKVIETTAGEAILKGIGFQPNAVAKVQDASVTKARMIGLNKKVEAEIADLWAQGRFENDPAKVDDARNRLKDWNRQNPDSPIRIQQGQIQKRVKAMRMSKAERIAKTAPKEIRADVRRDLAEVNQ